MENKPKKKFTTAQLCIFCVLAVIAVLLAVLIVVMVRRAPGNAAAETVEPAQVQTDVQTDTAQTGDTPAASADAAADAQTSTLPEGVVLECGDYQLNARDYNYYYWDTYFGIVGSYGSTITDYFDPSVPLADQVYDADSGATWEDNMRSMTLSTAIQVTAFATIAAQEGFTLPDSYAQELETTKQGYAQVAADQGYESLDAYLQATYGPEADETSYWAYQQTYLLATAYTDTLYDQPTFTDAEVEAYFDQYAQDYANLGVEKSDQNMVNLRHLLIVPQDTEDEASWDAAKAELDDIYAQWEADGSTEEAFAALAESYSADTASVGNGGDWTEAYNGGLYTQVYNGAMDEAFSQWLFQETREPGDTTMIRTDRGWHLLYYVSQADLPFWRYTAQLDLRYETYQNASNTLLADWPYNYNSQAAILNTPEGLYS